MSLTGKKKLFVFYLTLFSCLLLLAEGASYLTVRYILTKMAEEAEGVDLSQAIVHDEHFGFTLDPDRCQSFPYGQHDLKSYKPETPNWELCSNKMGFRAHDFDIDKPPNAFRLICLGDSNTMGQGVPKERTYCERLGELLRPSVEKQGLKLETINMAIWGFSSFQGLILFEKHVKKMNPDIVTVAFGANDRHPFANNNVKTRDRLVFKLPGEGKTSALIITREDWNITKAIKLFGIMFQQLNYSRVKPKDSDDYTFTLMERRATPSEYAENIELLLEGIQRIGAIGIALGIAVPEAIYREALLEAVKKKNAPYLLVWELFEGFTDPQKIEKLFPIEKRELESRFEEKAFEKSGIYNRYLTIDDAHPTIIGHEIIARELQKIILPLIVERYFSSQK